MAGDYGNPSGAEAQAAERARRRAEERRRLRRQRLLAIGGIVLVGDGIVAVAANSGEVRNATPRSGWKPHTGRREYGVPVKDFCYPAGRFDETTIAAVEAAGYVGATTEIPGLATKDHPYELARIEVLGSWTVGDLASALRG